MNTFYCLFEGHWPVGACAVIVAPDEMQAELDLRTALRENYLDEFQDLVLNEIDTTEQKVQILLDGDY